ncbi:TPA: hypothetical protein KD862_003592 [Vibrio cholerae]|uniref:hypothetical protein n=2 Tax=Vibrio cholerae TaxID=666 RepID=UPI0018F0D06E|nr:hypothetical protein [Vibrio cholerae]ELL7125133.1 hypothetical protein [Vibrio cholerae]MBJ6907185.1 hypothetical protein [Vibrio cholerae]MCR9707703.1 hypothetical protein [Vibrio cholerae]HBC3849638.1 hypothetical protein [Vibrio cholerae]
MISKFGSFLVLVLSLSDSSFAEELDTFQYEGQSYDSVKSGLLAKGWKILPKEEYEQSIDDKNEEIVCGSGLMAICSVGFQNDSRQITFVVEKSGNKIIVLGEY